jgi:hypothetical protein
VSSGVDQRHLLGYVLLHQHPHRGRAGDRDGAQRGRAGRLAGPQRSGDGLARGSGGLRRRRAHLLPRQRSADQHQHRPLGRIHREHGSVSDERQLQLRGSTQPASDALADGPGGRRQERPQHRPAGIFIR